MDRIKKQSEFYSKLLNSVLVSFYKTTLSWKYWLKQSTKKINSDESGNNRGELLVAGQIVGRKYFFN